MEFFDLATLPAIDPVVLSARENRKPKTERRRSDHFGGRESDDEMGTENLSFASPIDSLIPFTKSTVGVARSLEICRDRHGSICPQLVRGVGDNY